MLCNSLKDFPESPPTALRMADQGFRQPQFSEDSAWLPTWLQTHFLECGMQPINSNSTSKIECKALEGFLGSIRHAEEAKCGSPLEMVRRQIYPLVFSGDDCTASDTNQSIENELAFHLSLSSENDMEISATKDSVRPSQEKCHCHVALDKLEIKSDTNQNLLPCPETSTLRDVTEDPISHNVWPEEKIPIQDECTPCTELYVPGNVHQGDNTNNTICGDSCDPTFFATASELLDNKISPSSACGTSNNETCVPQQTVMGSVQNSSKQSRKTKSFDKSEGHLRNKTSDIDIAIGLTVAAAEALVISDILETCRLSESIGSSEILEAAIKLKQARQMCGLDRFSDFSSGPMDALDDSCLDELDDNFMQDAFADVGLCTIENTVSPFGLSCANVFEFEDAKMITHKKKCLLLSTSEELGGVPEGRSVTPSKLELKVRGFDAKKDDGVIVSAATTSISDTTVLRCLNKVNGGKGQQNNSMGKAQIVLECDVGSTINNGVNTKPSESGLFAASIARSSENSLNRDMGSIRLEKKPQSTAYEKYDKAASFQTQIPYMENLVHCSHKSENEVVEIVAATPYCDNDAVDKGMNCESANEIANGVQSNVISSPSWFHLTGNKAEEILSHGIFQFSDSLEWQSQIQAGNSHTKESENACNTECPRQYVSRWFGGWTGLDKEMETNKKFEVTKHVQKPFVEETSYLTESLDIDRGCAAPVEFFSSQVIKLPLNNIYPISDMYIQDLSSTNNEVSYSLTQNFARCLNSPVYDPLCSIVPCSIPQEDNIPTQRTDAEIQELDSNSSGKLHTNASQQLHEGLKPLQEENMVQLSKPSEYTKKESRRARTCSVSGESQFHVKRKRVDSLKQYSTLSGMLQGGSIEHLCETKEAGFHGDSIIIPDSMESLQIDCPGADTLIPNNDKKGVNKEAGPPRESVIQDCRENLTRVYPSADAGRGIPNNNNTEVVYKLPDIWLESAPMTLTRDMENHNGSTEEETPGRKQIVFQDQCKDAVTINSIATGNLREHKDFDCTQKASGNLGIELDYSLDVEESSPLLLHCRKRRRLRAVRINESECEDSKWDKATTTCPNQYTAPVSDNVEHFELATNVFQFPDLYQQESHEQFFSKRRGDSKNLKRVHFSEDIIEHQAVCHDVSGPINQFEASFRVQNAKMGKKIGDAYRKSKKEKNSPDLRFQGLEFLLTGLSTNKKNELEQLIREHGGVVLTNLPPLSHTCMRGRLKTEHLGGNYPIILSSQQVHTTKFLYGCAVGSLLLQPSWITDSIAAKCFLPFDKYRLRSNASNTKRWAKQNHIDAIVENAVPLFSGMRIMLYGKPTFYSKLMILIKHGGGLVFRTIESLVHGCESSEAVIVVENVRSAPRHLRQCASEYMLPVMSGNWVIESLLLGRLLPFQTNVSFSLQSLGKRGHFRRFLTKKPFRCQIINDPGSASPLGVDKIGVADQGLSKTVKGAFSKECIQLDGSSTVCSPEFSVTPIAVPKLGIKLPWKYAELSAKQKHQPNCLYYQYVALNGVHYSVGDVLELEPLSETKKLCFARVECLWSKQVAKKKTRSTGSKPVTYFRERMFLQCRWFYQPSDTGFPCTGSGKEIYISNHFCDVAVQKIKRKVSIVFMVEGKILPLNGPCEKEKGPSSCSRVDDQIIDFICKFFYDHENESLHQIKFSY